MTVYSSGKAVRGIADKLLHYHVWSVGRTLYHCWHYNLDDETAKRLIAEGKVQPFSTLAACMVGGTQHGHKEGA